MIKEKFSCSWFLGCVTGFIVTTIKVEVLENINFLLFVTATLYVQKGTSETFKVWELYEKFNKVVFFGYYGL